MNVHMLAYMYLREPKLRRTRILKLSHTRLKITPFLVQQILHGYTIHQQQQTRENTTERTYGYSSTGLPLKKF